MEIGNFKLFSTVPLDDQKIKLGKFFMEKNLIPYYGPFAERFIFRRASMQWWYEKYFFCVVFKIKVIEVGGGDLQSKTSALLEIF